MRHDIEKWLESKCYLPSCSVSAKQPRIKHRKKRRWMSETELSIQRRWWSQLMGKARQKTDRFQERAERPSCFCLVPQAPSAMDGNSIVWHLAPMGPGCYKPAVKCDAFCHDCALRLLLLFGCAGIRAGTRGSTVHPEESRFHIPEWNAFWHCSANPWFE